MQLILLSTVICWCSLVNGLSVLRQTSCLTAEYRCCPEFQEELVYLKSIIIKCYQYNGCELGLFTVPCAQLPRSPATATTPISAELPETTVFSEGSTILPARRKRSAQEDGEMIRETVIRVAPFAAALDLASGSVRGLADQAAPALETAARSAAGLAGVVAQTAASIPVAGIASRAANASLELAGGAVRTAANLANPLIQTGADTAGQAAGRVVQTGADSAAVIADRAVDTAGDVVLPGAGLALDAAGDAAGVAVESAADIPPIKLIQTGVDAALDRADQSVKDIFNFFGR